MKTIQVLSDSAILGDVELPGQRELYHPSAGISEATDPGGIKQNRCYRRNT